MIFENKQGIVRFGKGSPWKITDCSGFGPAKKTFQTVTYVTLPGQVTLSERQESRVITLHGDCRGDGRIISKGIRVLHEPGVFTIFCHGQRKQISAYCSQLEFGKPRGEYREFIVQFTADVPYFENPEEKDVSLFEREDLVQGSFSMPCIFTERISGGAVVNSGDVLSEPILIIKNMQSSSALTDELIIENKTTGSKLVLAYALHSGETVSVDIARRRINSDRQDIDNHGGNLLGFLSLDSFLHEFVLAMGENYITITPEHLCMQYSIQCVYREKYLEAVI